MKKNILKLLLILLSMCFIFPLSSFSKLIVTEGKFDTAPILNGKGRIILKVIETSGHDMSMSSDGSQESVMFNMQLHNIIVDDSMMNNNTPDSGDVSGDGTMFEYFIANMTEDNTSMNMQRSEDIGAFEIVSLELDVNVLEGTDDSELDKGFSVSVEGDDTNKYFDGAISSYTSVIRSTIDITSPNHKSEHTIEELENMSVSGTANNVNANNSISLFINNILSNDNVSIDSDGSWSSDNIDFTSFTDFTDANPRELSQYRYIAIEQNGSNANAYNHFVEVRVLSHDGTIIPYIDENISIMNLDASGASTGNEVVEFRGGLDRIHDGDTSSNRYTEPISERYIRLTIDFGELKDIASVHMWRYYSGSRRYNQSVVKVSRDGVNWVIISDGIEYTESSSGKNFIVPPVNQISTYNIKAKINSEHINIENTVSVREENTNESIEILEPMHNDILNIDEISQVATMWRVKNHYIGSSAELKNDISNSAITMNFDDNDVIETQTDELNLSIEDNRYRYIAVEQNGNSFNHHVAVNEFDIHDRNGDEISYSSTKIEAYELDSNGEVNGTVNFTGGDPASKMNNGITIQGDRALLRNNGVNMYTRIVIDLEEQKDIGYVKLWRFYTAKDPRSYNQSAVKVSKDETNWITLSNGIDYIETDKGKTFYTSYAPKRNIVATLYDENNDTLDTYEVELTVNYGTPNLLDTNITYNYDDINFTSEENIYLGTIENSNEVTPYEFEFVIDDNNESRFFVIENDGSIYYKAGSSVSSDLILSNYTYSLKVRAKSLGNETWSNSTDVNLTFISEFEISDITITPTNYNADNRNGVVRFEFSGALDIDHGLNEFNVMAENGVLDNFVASDNRRIWTADFTADTDIDRDVNNIIKLVEDNLSSIQNDSLESITTTNANLNSNLYIIDTKKPILYYITSTSDSVLNGGDEREFTFTFRETLKSTTLLEITDISAENGELSDFIMITTNRVWRVKFTANSNVYAPNSEIKLKNEAYSRIKDVAGNSLNNTGVKKTYTVGTETIFALESITGIGNDVLNTNDRDWYAVIYRFNEPINNSISSNDMKDLLQGGAPHGVLSNVRISENRKVWTLRYNANLDVDQEGVRLSIPSSSLEGIINEDGDHLTDSGPVSDEFDIDTKRPTLNSITSTSDSVLNGGDEREFTFTFSENLKSTTLLEITDISADNGELSDFRLRTTNKVWRVKFTANSNVYAPNSEIKLSNEAYSRIKDVAGNSLNNTGVKKTYTVGTENTFALESITGIGNDVLNTNDRDWYAVIYRFNEPINNSISSNDMKDLLQGGAPHGVLSNVRISENRKVWTLRYNANLDVDQEGVRLSIPSSSLEGIINENGDRLTDSGPVSDEFDIDTKKPTLDAITGTSYGVLNGGDEREFTFTFSERLKSSTLLEITDISADNGELSDFIMLTTNRVWRVKFTANSNVYAPNSEIKLSNEAYSRIKDVADNTLNNTGVKKTYIVGTEEAGNTFALESITGIGNDVLNTNDRDWYAVIYRFSEPINNSISSNEMKDLLQDGAPHGVLSNVRISENREVWTLKYNANLDLEREGVSLSIPSSSLEGIINEDGDHLTDSGPISDEFDIDTKKPTLNTITSTSNSVLNGGDEREFTFTFRERLKSTTLLEITDISAENGELSDFIMITTNRVWRVKFTANSNVYAPNSEIKLSNEAYSRIKDVADNTLNNTGVKKTYTVGTEETGNTFALESITGIGNDVLNTNDRDWYAVIYRFSEPINNSISSNEMKDLLQDGAPHGVLSNVRISENREVWTLKYNANLDLEREGVSLSIPSSSLEGIINEDGDHLTDSGPVSDEFDIDTKKPTLNTITSTSNSVLNGGDEREFTFTFSEELKSTALLEITDISADNGELSDFIMITTNRVWRVKFTANASVYAPNSEIKLKNEAYSRIKDEADNSLNNTGVKKTYTVGTEETGNTFALESITGIGNDVLNTNDRDWHTVIYRFNEPINNSINDDEMKDLLQDGAPHGVLSNVRISENREVWTLKYNANLDLEREGVSLSIPSSSLEGIINENGDHLTDSGPVSTRFDIDTKIPTLNSITSTSNSVLNGGDERVFIFTFSEELKSNNTFEITDISAENGELSDFIEITPNIAWSVRFTADYNVNDSSNTIKIRNSSVDTIKDESGNALGEAGPSKTYSIQDEGFRILDFVADPTHYISQRERVSVVLSFNESVLNSISNADMLSYINFPVSRNLGLQGVSNDRKTWTFVTNSLLNGTDSGLITINDEGYDNIKNSRGHRLVNNKSVRYTMDVVSPKVKITYNHNGDWHYNDTHDRNTITFTFDKDIEGFTIDNLGDSGQLYTTGFEIIQPKRVFSVRYTYAFGPEVLGARVKFINRHTMVDMNGNEFLDQRIDDIPFDVNRAIPGINGEQKFQRNVHFLKYDNDNNPLIVMTTLRQPVHTDKFSDGSPIPSWNGASRGADTFSYPRALSNGYSDEVSTGDEYLTDGFNYQFYAALDRKAYEPGVDQQGLCPSGYHVYKYKDMYDYFMAFLPPDTIAASERGERLGDLVGSSVPFDSMDSIERLNDIRRYQSTGSNFVIHNSGTQGLYFPYWDLMGTYFDTDFTDDEDYESEDYVGDGYSPYQLVFSMNPGAANDPNIDPPLYSDWHVGHRSSGFCRSSDEFRRQFDVDGEYAMCSPSLVPELRDESPSVVTVRPNSTAKLFNKRNGSKLYCLKWSIDNLPSAYE